ncbi:MAG TPA: tetratricopeptide repeat protein [Methylomirabilota bacterium]|nr:tetratricopeptide repeat protein [Methylomirabilota bacterium]
MKLWLIIALCLHLVGCAAREQVLAPAPPLRELGVKQAAAKRVVRQASPKQQAASTLVIAGIEYFERGKYEEAIELLEAAAQLDPRDDFIGYYLQLARKGLRIRGEKPFYHYPLARPRGPEPIL